MASDSPGGTRTYDIQGTHGLDVWKRQLERDIAGAGDDDDADLRAEYERRLREKEQGDVAALGGGSDSDSDEGGASPLPNRKDSRVPAVASDATPSVNFAGQFDWNQAGLAQASELTARNAQLLTALGEREREIDKLRALIDSIEPVEGVDVEKFRDILENGPDDVEHDIRDMKIVELAKKARKTNRMLQKERAKSARLANELARLRASAADGGGGAVGDGARLSRAPASPAKEAARKRRQARQRAAMRGETLPDSEDEAAAADADRARAGGPGGGTRAAQELRARLDRVSTELRQTRAALARELGEGDLASAAAVARALEASDGWRGRAEQVTALRAKVRRLQEQLRHAQAGPPAASRGTAAAAAAAAAAAGRGGDDKARAAIEERAQARKRQVEGLARENEWLKEEAAEARRRGDAARARVAVLERAQKQAAGDVKALLGKSEADDELVGALREEVARLQRQAAEAQAAAARAGPAPRAAVVRDRAAEERQRHAESALRRRLEEQGATIERLEAEIASSRGTAPQMARSPMCSGAAAAARREDLPQGAVRALQSARERAAAIEVGRLEETLTVLREKLRQAQEREEDSQVRLGELERACMHLERQVSQQQGPPREAGAGRDQGALRAELDQREEEAQALKASARRALAAKDDEIAGLRRTIADQKRAFEDAMAAFAMQGR